MTTPHTPDDLPPDAVPGLSEYSAAEQRRRFAPPTGFADRVTTGALRQRRKRGLARWTVGLSLAASVLAAVGLFATGAFDGRTPEVVNRPVPPAVVEQPAPTKVRDQLAEAGAALESLTRETTDKAVGPTMILLDSATRATAPADPSPLADDPTLALASLPSAARSSLDPITTTTRRAMTRLLKDVGLRPH